MVRVSLDDYEEIVDPSRDCPGPSPQPAKAAKMRSWFLPQRFNEEGSRDAAQARKISFPLALVTEDCAFLFVDFPRLLTVHVISLDRPWLHTDLAIGSKVCGNRSYTLKHVL